MEYYRTSHSPFGYANRQNCTGEASQRVNVLATPSRYPSAVGSASQSTLSWRERRSPNDSFNQTSYFNRLDSSGDSFSPGGGSTGFSCSRSRHASAYSPTAGCYSRDQPARSPLVQLSLLNISDLPSGRALPTSHDMAAIPSYIQLPEFRQAQCSTSTPVRHLTGGAGYLSSQYTWPSPDHQHRSSTAVFNRVGNLDRSHSEASYGFSSRPIVNAFTEKSAGGYHEQIINGSAYQKVVPQISRVDATSVKQQGSTKRVSFLDNIWSAEHTMTQTSDCKADKGLNGDSPIGVKHQSYSAKHSASKDEMDGLRFRGEASRGHDSSDQSDSDDDVRELTGRNSVGRRTSRLMALHEKQARYLAMCKYVKDRLWHIFIGLIVLTASIGIVTMGFLVFVGTFRKLEECPTDAREILIDVENIVFGQHIAVETLREALGEFFHENSSGMSVVSLHGWTGVGKDHLAATLAHHFTDSALMTIVPLHFSNNSNWTTTRQRIIHDISSSPCQTHVLTINEIEAASAEQVEMIQDLLSHLERTYGRIAANKTRENYSDNSYNLVNRGDTIVSNAEVSYNGASTRGVSKESCSVNSDNSSVSTDIIGVSKESSDVSSVSCLDESFRGIVEVGLEAEGREYCGCGRWAHAPSAHQTTHSKEILNNSEINLSAFLYAWLFGYSHSVKKPTEDEEKPKLLVLLLSSVGGREINSLTFHLRQIGRLRDDLTCADYIPLLTSVIGQSPHFTSLFLNHSVDYLIPMLPLEGSHVMQCIDVAIQQRRVHETRDVSVRLPIISEIYQLITFHEVPTETLDSTVLESSTGAMVTGERRSRSGAEGDGMGRRVEDYDAEEWSRTEGGGDEAGDQSHGLGSDQSRGLSFSTAGCRRVVELVDRSIND